MPIQPFRLLAMTCLAICIGHVRAASIGDFLDENGNYLGSDGLNNDSLYILKTSLKDFAGGGRASGIAADEANKARKYVVKWKGVTDSFRQNPWIYNDFQRMEWRDSIREQMLAIVSKDDGPGEKGANNREFGGTVAANYQVVESPPGEISSPGKEVRIALRVRSNTIEEFHSHPSGRSPGTRDSSTGNSQKVPMSSSGELPQPGLCSPCDYCQPPSPEDIRQIGIRPGPDSLANGERIADRVGYVFGMYDHRVYIFTDKGITAVLPIKRFVHYHTKQKL